MRYRTLTVFSILWGILSIPAWYCLSCAESSGEPLIRLAGSAVLAGLLLTLNRHRILAGAAAFCWVAGGCMEGFSYLHSGHSFDLRYLHHLSPRTIYAGNAGFGMEIAAGLILPVLGTAAIVLLLRYTCRKNPGSTCNITLSLLLLLSALAGSPLVPAGMLAVQICFALRQMDRLPEKSRGIKGNLQYKDRIKALPGKNLVLVYLESLEDHYFDEKLFPGLLPNLTALRRESIDFTDMTMARNADFTFGGIYSSLTGSILTYAHYAVSGASGVRNNAGFDPDLGSRLPGLPGVLRSAGYFQMMIVGHDPRFSGMDIFAGTIGYDRIFSALQLWADGKHGPMPHAIWGVRDRTLLALSGATFCRLAENRTRPFQLAIVTVDAHHPDGFTEPDGPRYPNAGPRDPGLLHALYAMDHWTGEFIARLKKSPAWPDTVVVLMTDHLAMRNTLWSKLHDGRPRKLVFFALNAGPSRKISVPGKTFDAAPTILDLMQVRHNAGFPLGESLLGAPDPGRLSGDAPERDRLLTGCLENYSTKKLPAQAVVRVLRKPYPALQFGSRRLPLFTVWGIPELPEGEESFGVRITRERTIQEARRFQNIRELQEWTDRKNDGDLLVILSADTVTKKLTGGRITGMQILTGYQGSWRAVRDEEAL